MKKIVSFIVALSLFPLFASGQERMIKEEGRLLFMKHAYIEVQGGASYTLGESGPTNLLSPSAALNIGYRFSPVFGMRLGASGWQGKGEWVVPSQTYDFKFVQGNLDFVIDLGSLFGGFNPDRIVSPYAFVGGSYAYGFKNGAAELNTRGYDLEYLWKDHRGFPGGHMGLGLDFRISDRVALALEGNATVLDDRFNSKRADNPDWQFNALVGLKVNLGKTYTRTEPVYYEPEPVVEKPAEVKKVVEQPAPVVEKKVIAAEPIRKEVFFAINSSVIADEYQSLAEELAGYLNKYPNAKINVTGYADKETGYPRLNMKLSQNRAQAVVDLLTSKGISADRIVMSYKGDTEQPFGTPSENRVVICVAE